MFLIHLVCIRNDLVPGRMICGFPSLKYNLNYRSNMCVSLGYNIRKPRMQKVLGWTQLFWSTFYFPFRKRRELFLKHMVSTLYMYSFYMLYEYTLRYMHSSSSIFAQCILNTYCIKWNLTLSFTSFFSITSFRWNLR